MSLKRTLDQKLILSFVILASIFLLPVVFALEENENITIEIISNITLINDNTEGDGEIIIDPRSYLFEGEDIELEVLIAISSGIENLEVKKNRQGVLRPSVFMTLNDNIEANCEWGEQISDTRQKFRCSLTAETTDSMYGWGIVEVKARTIQGEEARSFVGEWFFNPFILPEIGNSQIDFLKARPGSVAYSEKIIIKNNIEEDSDVNVPVQMYISGLDFHGFNLRGGSCDIPLENFDYYAENGKFTTKEDFRSDRDGFVPIKYGIAYNNPDRFWGNNELVRREETSSYYPDSVLWENVLSEDEEAYVTLRVAIPRACSGTFELNNVYVWISPDNGWGPSGGLILPLRLNTQISTNKLPLRNR